VTRRRVTIREVARAAGVSTQTVSRVLNDRPDVAPETLERVRRVIVDMGYQPNMLARGLIQGRTHALGVVAYGLEYFGPSRIVMGIERQAGAMGYSMSLTLIHRPETDDVGDVLAGLAGRQVDGVIWAIPEIAGNRAWLRASAPAVPVPLVVVGGTAGEDLPPSIGIDNGAIGRLATGHLLEGGARRVGIVTGPLGWWEARERLAGWRATLRAAGRERSDRLVVEGDWSPSSGEEGLYELLRRRSDLDAVFASNDQMALGVLHAAHRLGLRVPEELSVVGVDDIAEGSHFWPPLTTILQPLADAGALAVEVVVQAISASRPGRRSEDARLERVHHLLEPRLIVRESSRQHVSGDTAVLAHAPLG
jgi:LacI family transcriptional regulator